jgi:hypothetical protein
MGLFNDLSGIDELGIVGPIDVSSLYESGLPWIQDSPAKSPRSIFFPLLSSPLPPIPPCFKSQWVPMKLEEHRAFLETGPFEALLSKVPISFVWMKAYNEFGSMVEAGSYNETLEGPGMAWTLWKWQPVAKPQRAFMMCHHCGVLPDLKRQLWFLGIQGDFFWLSDGKGPTGGQWPSTLGEYTSSVPLLKGPIGASEKVIEFIKAKYDIIITSHCMRYPLHFLEAKLPIIHVNSTRFGNEITTGSEFKDLCEKIKTAVNANEIGVIHNNEADRWYFNQYIKTESVNPVIPSLCTSALRFRIMDQPGPFLIWDTRFHITDKKDSILLKISEALGSRAKSTSELCNEKGDYLDDDYLDSYRAVIHIPYNISTMSCFEQAAANVPVWVPTPAFLEKILLEEHSELSWYAFGGNAEVAEFPDQFKNPATIHEFVSRCDFTGFKNVVFFDSVADLLERIDKIDYDTIIKQSFLHQTRKRLDVLRLYADFL